MDKSSSISFYNEERNLLRARERERRIREAQQEKTILPENPPLFAAPYKTDKADDLSNQIRKVLGNYEDVKGLINSKTQWNFLGLHEVLPPVSPEAPDFPHFPDENTSPTSSSSFHEMTCHPHTAALTAPPAHHSTPFKMAQSRTKPDSGLHVQSGSSSSGQSQSHKCSRGDKECHEGLHHRGTDRRAAGEGRADDLGYSIFQFSSFLTPLPPPLEPLSPLRSDLHVTSKSEKSSKSQELTYSQTESFQEQVTGSEEEQSQDSSDINLTSSTRPSSQTCPTALPSKCSATQQKPTAYVRPMDGHDQAPEESPDLKPLLEEYHREPFEKISDLKRTFHCDAQAVNEILKEMTQSWPPLLTEIPTPTYTEPSKFPLPTKESQYVGYVAQDRSKQKSKGERPVASPDDGPSDTLLRSQTTVSASNWKASYEYQTEDFLPPPLPPMPPAPKSTRVAQKRPRSESDELTAIDNTAKSKSDDKDPLICKHRKVESNEADLSKDIKCFLGISTQHRMSCD